MLQSGLEGLKFSFVKYYFAIIRPISQHCLVEEPPQPLLSDLLSTAFRHNQEFCLHVNVDAVVFAFSSALNLLTINVIAKVLIILLEFTMKRKNHSFAIVQAFRVGFFNAYVSMNSQSKALSISWIL